MDREAIDCPECGSMMILSDGVYRCKRCKLEIAEEDYIIVNVFGDDEIDYDDMPEGCAACVGDYPNCVDSCPMYDD